MFASIVYMIGKSYYFMIGKYTIHIRRLVWLFQTHEGLPGVPDRGSEDTLWGEGSKMAAHTEGNHISSNKSGHRMHTTWYTYIHNILQLKLEL